jgi:hypothetical protein
VCLITLPQIEKKQQQQQPNKQTREGKSFSAIAQGENNNKNREHLA